MAFTFRKEERLSGLKAFETLTKKGESFFAHPFRITWMMSAAAGMNGEEQEYPVRIAFAVPKRNFRQAVKRNRIKRLLREAYRKHKHELYAALELKSVKIVVMFIYTGKEVPSYSETEGKIILSLRRLLNAIDGAGKHT
jgi:ribonuclease P protein component